MISGLAILQDLAIVGAGLAGLLMIARASLGVYRLAKRVEAVHDAVLTELLPNGGSTLVDRVEVIERELAEYQTIQSGRWDLIARRLGLEGQ